MTTILGVSALYHDSAAAVLRQGMLVAAAQEERFSRVKHDPRYPRRAIESCLRTAGVDARELDYVAFYERPLRKLDRVAGTAMATLPGSWRTAAASAGSWVRSKLWIRDTICGHLGTSPGQVLFVDHHLAHAASAFFCSPFDESAVLVVDAVGEWATASVGIATARWGAGSRNTIRLSRQLDFPHSVGLLYSSFTQFLGFDVNDGEYKVMGLAAYGRPVYADRIREIVEVYPDGSVWLDLRYFDFLASRRRMFSDRLERLLGVPPRAPDTPLDVDTPASAPCVYADVAASIQAVLEEIIERMAQTAGAESGSDNLCMAGGVALNGAANRRAFDGGRFENLFIAPAAGDAGCALGAALYVYHVLLGGERRFVMEHAYWGGGCDHEGVRSALAAANVAYTEFDDERRLVAHVATSLARGRLVGWLQGRFEWGPRALGNRSILADAGDPANRRRVNERVKFRETFRPFAPAMVEPFAREAVASPLVDQFPARYMLLVLPVGSHAAERIPAASHAGTARIQTVRPEWNPRFHALLEAFGERSGTPALLNTSFNVRGEPIVATPADALRTFARAGLDELVLGDCVVTRS